MGGYLVRISSRYHKQCDAEKNPEGGCVDWRLLDTQRRTKGIQRASPASQFQLPKVCRQMYSETVLAAFEQNIYYIRFYNTMLSTWSSSLLPAQRNAITRVSIGRGALFAYMRLALTNCTESVHPEKAIRKKLPSLKTIFVSQSNVKDAQNRARNWRFYRSQDCENDEKRKDSVVKNLKDREGSDIEVEFEEYKRS